VRHSWWLAGTAASDAAPTRLEGKAAAEATRGLDVRRLAVAAVKRSEGRRRRSAKSHEAREPAGSARPERRGWAAATPTRRPAAMRSLTRAAQQRARQRRAQAALGIGLDGALRSCALLAGVARRARTRESRTRACRPGRRN
jgi:hypothetical protein